ncbi:MAG TPA: glutamine amidotransferase [Nocardioidaceae bacterium]|nr:glutamine amidotransferase [Nocardioidaceae bacterium]
MKPFLLLATRAEAAPADQEYAAFRRFGGLAPEDLERRRLEQGPLGAVDLDGYSGIILGGSPFTITDPPEKKSPVQVRVEAELASLMREVVDRDFPFLGACYGIGIIGTFVGAVVDRTFPEPVGATTLTLTDAGRDDPLLGVLPSSFEAFVGHKEAISKLPNGIVSLASSEACPVQAFRVGANVYATQFHPELDVPGIVTRIEAYKTYGYFDPASAEDLKDAARASDVRHPMALVRRFVELYARP